MHYYIIAKDDIAFQIHTGSTAPNFPDCKTFDISEEELYSLQLPAKLVNGKWEHTEEYPTFPEPEPIPEPEPSISIEDTTLDMLADHEARLSEIELGITTTTN